MRNGLAIGLGGFAAMLAIYVGWSIARADQNAIITVDFSQKFQKISGWEATARFWEEDKAGDRFDGSWKDSQGPILDALVNTAGINRLRIEFRSGAENPVDYWVAFSSGKIGYQEFRKHRYEKINDNADPEVINKAGFQFGFLDYQVENVVLPMRERLAARGERLFVNLCYVDFKSGEQGNLSHAESPKEYAELMAAGFQHLKEKYGFTPDALEIVLEPDNTYQWRGRQIGLAIVETAARLKRLGFAPEFIAPSTTSAAAAPQYIDDMMGVTGVAGVVHTFSYHNYDNSSDETRSQILARGKKYGVETAMLEHEVADAKELYQDLTVTQISAWQHYGIAYRDTPETYTSGGSLLLVDAQKPPGQRVRLARAALGLTQYFRHIREGAVRVSATSDQGGSEPVAFLNKDGRLVVIVRSENAGNLTLRGVKPGQYVVESSTEDGAAPVPVVMPTTGDTLAVQLQKPAVVSISQK